MAPEIIIALLTFMAVIHFLPPLMRNRSRAETAPLSKTQLHSVIIEGGIDLVWMTLWSAVTYAWTIHSHGELAAAASVMVLFAGATAASSFFELRHRQRVDLLVALHWRLRRRMIRGACRVYFASALFFLFAVAPKHPENVVLLSVGTVFLFWGVITASITTGFLHACRKLRKRRPARET